MRQTSQKNVINQVTYITLMILIVTNVPKIVGINAIKIRFALVSS